MTKLLIILSVFSISNVAQAIGSISATVADVRVDRSGLGIIAFSQSIGGEAAACRVTPYTSHFSFDAKTEGGKAIYSMALTAVASGKKMVAYGTGSCLDYANTVESISYGHLLTN